MDERVSRRGVFRKLLIDGVDAVGHLLSEATGCCSEQTVRSRTLTSEEAGLLLPSRKTSKKGFHLNTPGTEKTIRESNVRNSTNEHASQLQTRAKPLLRNE